MESISIDEFARTLLEEAKRFLEKSDVDDAEASQAYLHASLMLAFCALEAHVNAIGDDFAIQKGLSAHDLGILQEKTVELKDGEFKLKSALRMVPLVERIQFLHRKFKRRPIDKTRPWWQELLDALALRNQLTHPKGVASVNADAVGRAIQAIVDVLNVIYKAVYNRKFPAAGKGLHSRLDF